jgi:hypothetical protein
MDISAASSTKEHFRALQQHLMEDHPEALFVEVKVACDLTQDRDLVRCVDPSLLHFGPGRLFTYRIYEKLRTSTTSSTSGEEWTETEKLEGDL